MSPITLLLIALCLTACQSSTDRQWSDAQTILELTQPSKAR